MKNALTVFLLLLLLPFASAFTDQAKDGITVYDISSTTGLFAIALPKGTYEPGETISATIGSNVPCNTKSVTLTLQGQNGEQWYYKDISGLFSPCSTSYVKVTFSAPSTKGTHKILVTFKDGTGKELYTDATSFNVGTTTCPLGSCTDWTSTQRFEFGTIQQKTCYTYNQAATCQQSTSQFYRTDCDKGYVLVNNACVKPDNEPTCGDRVKQTGEACDLGDENGLCPATCTKMCTISNCQELPDEKPPLAPGDKAAFGSGALIFIGLIVVIIGVAGYFAFRKK